MEMEVGDGVLGHVSLSGEAKVTHRGFHDDLLILLAIDDIRVYALQDLDCFGDARLKLLKCLFVILKLRDVGSAKACSYEFGRVGAGLDLVR